MENLSAVDSDNDVATRIYTEQFQAFTIGGTFVVGTGKGRLVFPYNATILGVTPVCNTAPTGAAAIWDVNKNGTSIYPTSTKPQIAASSNSGTERVPDTTSISAGDYLTVDTDQIGSTVAGADATLVVRFRRA